MNKTIILLLLSLFAGPFLRTAYASEPFDHSLWEQVIQTYTSEDGEVDYAALNADPAPLNAYFEKVNAIDPFVFNSPAWPREEKLALWLNVYNAGVLEAVRKNYPLENIQKIPGIWDDAFIGVAQRKYSLNSIRKGQLIEPYRDEKIHTALACGGKSCPPLFREAFTGPKVEGQLFLAARQFVNNPEFVEIVPGDKKVFLSRLLKWYGEDFKLDFGAFQTERKFTETENAVLSFIAHYLSDTDKLVYLEEKNYKIKYMPFDWAPREIAGEPA